MVALAVWVFAQMRRSVPGKARWVLTADRRGAGRGLGGCHLRQHRAGPGPQRLRCSRVSCTTSAATGSTWIVAVSGSPTVVLANGLGTTSASWARVTAPIAERTRVCAYDRAGQGWSDEASNPRDGIESAQDLHELLAAAGEHGPYVLVGHSHRRDVRDDVRRPLPR